MKIDCLIHTHKNALSSSWQSQHIFLLHKLMKCENYVSIFVSCKIGNIFKEDMIYSDFKWKGYVFAAYAWIVASNGISMEHFGCLLMYCHSFADQAQNVVRVWEFICDLLDFGLFIHSIYEGVFKIIIMHYND